MKEDHLSMKPHIYRTQVVDVSRPRAQWYSVWAVGRRDKRGHSTRRRTFQEICIAAAALQGEPWYDTNWRSRTPKTWPPIFTGR